MFTQQHLIPRIISSILFTLALIVLLAQNGHAYLDPGTGSYIFQLLVGFLVGAFFTIKVFWGRIKTFFTNIFSKRVKG
jgi:hypothetical protein